jgi:tRNA(fMet)-specific endonuclease VapC
MHLLDTDTLLHLWAGHERVVQRLAETEDTEIATTSITRSEILRRRCENLLKADSSAAVVKAQELLDRSEQQLSPLTVIPFDEAAAEQFDRLLQIGRLKRIGRADLLVASVALANHATVVTRNLRHFRQVPGLALENWVD